MKVRLLLTWSMVYNISYYMIINLQFFILFGLLINKRKNIFCQTSVLLIVSSSILLLLLNAIIFNRFELQDLFILFILLFSVIWLNSINNQSHNYFEFLIFYLLILIGFILLLSTTDLILVFLAFEIISLSSYSLIAINNKSVKAVEGSLKYLIQGSLITIFFLLGLSLNFSFSNSFHLNIIYFFSFKEINLFILILILFKLGSFPFQIWVSNVYSSSQYQVVSLISTLSKLAIVLFSISIIGILKLNYLLNYGILILPLMSLIIGYSNLLNQSLILKFIAYSSIANSGWILFGLLLNNAGVSLEYCLLYILNLILFFGLISSFKLKNCKKKELNYLIELTNIQYINKGLSISFIITLLNFFALPPFSSFYPKLNVLFTLINYNYNWISLIAILFSVLGTINYIKFIWILNNSTTEYNSNMVLFLLSNKVTPMKFNVSIIISLLIYVSVSYGLIKNVLGPLVCFPV